ncbi:MAG: BNR repeat-containing protein [Chitinispirillaceae bacterium]|nr:BNR repeat-containing protein [Chitinispirillaceae bacterium]
MMSMFWRSGVLPVSAAALCMGAFPLGAQTLTATKVREDTVTRVGLTVEHYDKLLNGQAYQQNAIMSYNGYQYAVYWNSSRHVCIWRKNISTNVAQTLELTDYTNTLNDSHNNIMMGICPTDGTIHLSFDHHDAVLKYRKSVNNLANDPGSFSWVMSNFGAIRDNFTGTQVTLVTYPRFITAPSGNVLFECRIGSSGNGDAYLWEYSGSSGTWTSLGKYIDGVVSGQNPYLFGINYGPDGRLHVTWCWRVDPNGSTNHDLYYAYSSNNGRTWYDNGGTQRGTTGTAPMTMSMTSLRVWTIAQNRGYINQESQAVDKRGRIHVLASYLPDAAGNITDFNTARAQAVVYHFHRDTAGAWHRNLLNTLAKVNRGQIAFDSLNNAYAALYNVRLYGATARSNWTDWHLLNPGADTSRFYSEVLVDKERLLSGNVLSFVNPVRTTGHIYVLTYGLSGQTGVIDRETARRAAAPLRFTRKGDLLVFSGVAPDASYSVCTADGVIVNQGRGNSIAVDGMAPGCYLVRINGGTVKFIK